MECVALLAEGKHCILFLKFKITSVGLQTPPSCELVVGGEPQCWSEGHCLLFDDSFLHTVCHKGWWITQRNVILSCEHLIYYLVSGELLANMYYFNTEISVKRSGNIAFWWKQMLSALISLSFSLLIILRTICYFSNCCSISLAVPNSKICHILSQNLHLFFFFF